MASINIIGIVALVAASFIGIAFLGMLVMFLYSFNKVLNYLLFIIDERKSSFADLFENEDDNDNDDDEINFNELEEFVVDK